MTDPHLICSHLNLSIMTDGPALSCCLLFVAALARILGGHGRPWVWISLALLGQLGGALLRPEKSAVMAGAGLLAVLLHLIGTRQRPDAVALRRRGGLAALLVVLGALAVTGVKAVAHTDRGAWPVRTTLLHFRVIYPHLERIHPHLAAVR